MKIDDIELVNRIIDSNMKEGDHINVANAKAAGRLAALLCIALNGDVAYVEYRVKEIMAIEPPRGE